MTPEDRVPRAAVTGGSPNAFDDEIEDPADNGADAIAQGDRCMALAQHYYAAASQDINLKTAALQTARASYFQLRALSLYQWAAILREDEPNQGITFDADVQSLAIADQLVKERGVTIPQIAAEAFSAYMEGVQVARAFDAGEHSRDK